MGDFPFVIEAVNDSAKRLGVQKGFTLKSVNDQRLEDMAYTEAAQFLASEVEKLPLDDQLKDSDTMSKGIEAKTEGATDADGPFVPPPASPPLTREEQEEKKSLIKQALARFTRAIAQGIECALLAVHGEAVVRVPVELTLDKQDIAQVQNLVLNPIHNSDPLEI